MKKFLIVLLFFGFSFGQEITNSDIEGVWDVVSGSNSGNYSFIFKEDNSGYFTSTDIDREQKTITSNFLWTLIPSKKNSRNGTIIIDFYNWNDNESNKLNFYKYLYFRSEWIDSDFLEMYFQNKKEWKGGDVLLTEFGENIYVWEKY